MRVKVLVFVTTALFIGCVAASIGVSSTHAEFEEEAKADAKAWEEANRRDIATMTEIQQRINARTEKLLALLVSAEAKANAVQRAREKERGTQRDAEQAIEVSVHERIARLWNWVEEKVAGASKQKPP
jgi:chemotaxis protein histidine kinase CheA